MNKESYSGIDFKSILFNIGTGEDNTIRQLADMIKNTVGFKGEILWDTTKPDGTPQKLLDVSSLKAQGWEAKIGLEVGLRSTYAWYVDQTKN
jgi:GDP-L-fucose synthase